MFCSCSANQVTANLFKQNIQHLRAPHAHEGRPCGQQFHTASAEGREHHHIRGRYEHQKLAVRLRSGERAHCAHEL